MSQDLKPFSINLADVSFLFDQVTFPTIKLIRYNSSGDPIYGYVDKSGNTHELGAAGTFDPTTVVYLNPSNAADPLNNLPLYNGPRDYQGLRNVTGFFNNLSAGQTAWGATGSLFLRLVPPDYLHYAQENFDVSVPSNPPVTTEVVSRADTDHTLETTSVGSITITYYDWYRDTVTTDTTTSVDNGHHIQVNNVTTVTTTTTDTGQYWVQDASGAHLVTDGVTTVGDPSVSTGISGGELDPAYHNFHGVTNGVTGPADYSNPLASVVDYTPRMISQLITSSAATVNGATPDNAMTRSGVATTDVTYDIIDPITKVVVEKNHTETYVENVNSVALDPPYSGWFVLFGQFFDHGLDFIAKPGNGPTIQIPLAVNDPLYGTIGTDGQPVTSITINRATPVAGTGTDPATNPAQYVNNTSPYIDQSQTYGSIDQITLLLRQWVPDPNNPGHFIPGSQLLDGHTVAAYQSKVFDDAGHAADGSGLTTRTLPTLNELRAALVETGRADLSWEDISNYRIRDENGQIWDSDPTTDGVQAVGTGEPILLDNLPRFDNGHLTQSALDALNAAAGRTAGDGNLLYFDGGQLADPTLGPGMTGFAVLIVNGWVDPSTNTITVGDPALHAAVGEIMLEAVGDHYIAGDGRANENFGLTTIHHVFHEDHNVQRVNLETSILLQSKVSDINGWQVAVSSTGDPTNSHIAVSGGHYVANDGVIAQNTDGNLFVAGAGDTLTGGSTFLLNGGSQISAVGSLTDASGYISWNQDRLFNGTKLIVEMEYQHVAIDQYARLVTPDLPEFVTYDSTINADISMEYAESAFRFGHSQLRDTIDALDPNNVVTGNIEHFALASAFLTPAAFAAVGPGALVEGMTHQIGNETDEFITPALQQSLLGQPLDLAAINIARGRDLGIPTLNEARKAIYNALSAERAAGGVQAQAHAKIDLGAMKPYDSWNDFQASMAHPESIVNFIAAYSFDGDLDKAQLVVDLASDNPLTANEANLRAALGWTASDAAQFMSNTGSTIAGAGNYDQIDLWLGGLAESHVIGGKLGATFNAIFEDQMERLMDGDRFYYLYRLFDALPTTLNLNESVVLQQFKDIIERTTGTQYLNGDVMNAADSYVSLYLNPTGDDPSVVSTLPGANGAQFDPIDHKYGALADQLHIGVYSTGGASTALNGQALKTLTAANGYTGANGAILGSYILDARPTSGATDQNGNPTYGYNSHEVIAGTAYNDYIDGGDGDDTLYGGAGNDILIGNGGGDHIYGGDGNDLIYGNGGTAGADVADFMDGGAGDDVIYGGANNGSTEIVIGGDGNDYLYGEAGIDEIYGGLGDDYIDAGSDTDVGFGDAGNDYLYGGEGPDTLYGGNGDDIVDGGSGTDKLLGENGDDILKGGIGGGVTQGDSDELIGDEQNVDDGFDIADYSNSNIQLDVAADLTQQNLVAAPGAAHGFQPFNELYSGINGLVGSKFGDTLIGDDAIDAVDPVAGTPISFANWLVGGSGSDTMRGNGGNDVIVGGSIKISQLIGTYQDFVGGNYIADPYTSSYDGASHRADPNAVLRGGILDWASLGGAFEKHYTELLKSQARKDFVLGDGGPDTGSTDTAVYGGNVDDYTVVALDANGDVIADPRANLASVFAIKITDHGDATVRTLDGTDLLIGVESFQFADGAKTLKQLFNSKPTGTVLFTEQDSPAGVSNAANAARFTSLSAIFDADNITSTNPTGAVTTGVTFSWAIPSGTPAATATVEASGSLLLHTTSGLLVTETGSYVDGGGKPESLSTTYNFIVGGSGNDALTGADISNGAGGTYGDVIVGLAGSDTLNGGAGDDFLYGGAGNDTLSGGAGNDRLDGGVGADIMTGGTGDDTYVVDNALDVVVENAGEGTDTVQSSITYALGADVENLTLTSAANINGTGNALDNIIAGNSGNNILTGGGGNDKIDGGAGTDIAIYSGTAVAATYGLSGTSLTVTTAADGTDTLTSIERLTFGAITYNLFYGMNGADTLTGSAAADILLGFGGNDTLNGGAGADIMIGGTGDDTYVVDSSGDVVVENAGEGVDTVQASFTYALGANVENLTLTGAGNINGTGNTLDNVMTGNTGNNLLTGGGGNDKIDGGAGTDTAIYSGTALAATFGLTGANLTITTAADGTDTLTNIERLTFGATTYNLFYGMNGADTLTGSGAADILLGFGGNDTLNGGAGADVMAGGTGDDTYVVDNTGDVVVENAGEGSDTVQSSIAYTLGANVENLTLTGVANINGTGNTLDNVITGNSGSNLLTGGGGNDTIDGGAGTDTAVYSGTAAAATFGLSGSSLTVTTAADGTDTLTNIERLTFGPNTYNLFFGTNGADPLLTGGGGADILLGLGGNDTLNGGAGADVMIGGTGDDTYVVDNTGDVVVENTGEGADTVRSSIAYTLGANVENLTLTGTSAVNGTGNALDNIITGNSGNNILTGGGGNDTFIGGAGGDTLNGSGGVKNTYSYTTLTDSLASNFDQITNFGALDQIQIGHAVASVGAVSYGSNIGNSLASRLGSALSGANSLGAGAVDVVQLTGGGGADGTYVVIDNGVVGFNATVDAVIKINAGASNIGTSSFV